MRLSLIGITALSCVLSAAAASAETINFNNQTGTNASKFTTDTQGRFTVAPSEGVFRVGQFFGDPVPDLYTLKDAATLTVQRKNGGYFDFTSVDLAVGSGSGTYDIVGLANGIEQFSAMGAITGFGTFADYNPGDSSDAINSLEIMLMNTGGSTDIDNIVVHTTPAPAAVTPEPSSLLLLATGGLGFAVLGRRRLFA